MDDYQIAIIIIGLISGIITVVNLILFFKIFRREAVDIFSMVITLHNTTFQTSKIPTMQYGVPIPWEYKKGKNSNEDKFEFDVNFRQSKIRLSIFNHLNIYQQAINRGKPVYEKKYWQKWFEDILKGISKYWDENNQKPDPFHKPYFFYDESEEKYINLYEIEWNRMFKAIIEEREIFSKRFINTLAKQEFLGYFDQNTAHPHAFNKNPAPSKFYKKNINYWQNNKPTEPQLGLDRDIAPWIK